MHADLVDILCCPVTGGPLALVDAEYERGRVRNGWLAAAGGARYPVRDFVPRFVAESNYADNFGFQWNRFSATQLDSHSGQPISADRFWHATQWQPHDLEGALVLDIGCGSGRFAEVALSAGAHVVALDYSTAVDACFANLGHHPNLSVVQGDIYALPFAVGRFAFVYSLGVLQHTPDVAGAFAALPPMLEPGGRLCVDFYERSWKSMMLPKYWLRPVTRRVPKPLLFDVLRRVVPVMLPVSRGAASVPFVGHYLRRVVPVANYDGVLPLSAEQNREWALLDTFDWLSPRYDNPQTPAAVRRYLEDAGLDGIEVLKAGHLVGRGSRPKVA